MRFLAVLTALFSVLAVLFAGCGQKGPLYLRDNPPPGYKPLKQPAPKPVPYPEADQPGR